MKHLLPDVPLTGTAYLNSYQPLRYTTPGVNALKKYSDLQPYEDASCRREPDFLHPLAPISGVCRGQRFVPRLKAGDVVAYMTKRMNQGHYLTAVLKVVETLDKKDSHKLVAARCQDLGLHLPGNCMVRGNEPLSLDRTGGFRSKGRETVAAVARADADEMTAMIRAWDGMYRKRVIDTPNIALTKPHYVELTKPFFLGDTHLIEAFGKVPYTLNPPKTTLARLNILLSSLGIEPVK